jgi:hypothetical protein
MVVIVRVTLPKAPRWHGVALGPGLRILGAALAGLVLCTIATTEAPVAIVSLKTVPAVKEDPRTSRLEKFFHRYRCPAPFHISEYLRFADFYKLDYRLLPAIAIRETQCGLYGKDNNHFGYHPGEGSFRSVEAGIEFIAQRLAEHPFYKGKTLYGKLFAYNPRPAYPGEVERIMDQIE